MFRRSSLTHASQAGDGVSARRALRQHSSFCNERESSLSTETKFENLGLADSLLRAVRAEGYETATPIQHKAIGPVLAGHDLMGCAQTGTGKTAAFALPTLQRLSVGSSTLAVEKDGPATTSQRHTATNTTVAAIRIAGRRSPIGRSGR